MCVQRWLALCWLAVFLALRKRLSNALQLRVTPFESRCLSFWRVSSLFLAVVRTGLTVTATQMDFGNGSLTRVSCWIDKGCNAVTDCRAYSEIDPAFAVDQWRKVCRCVC